MRHPSSRSTLPWLALVLPGLALALSSGTAGCATVAVAGASQGINYTITNVAYRTFTAPMAPVHAATMRAFKRMQIECPKGCEEKTGEGFKFRARTKELDIFVKLTPVTPKATKVAVDAKENFFVKDKPVAFEVINQIGLVLGLK
ncbi:MAG: DUF3568 family protein [Elusimicrobia bacterium]|nr:DUF3568 family protein [Elusimicrobiota bacterium]